MYYLVSGTDDDEFEWVVEANSIEEARQNALKDLSSNNKITSIKELSVNECIDRGYNELSFEIERYYLESHYDKKTITANEYFQIKKQLEENPNEYYKALKEFNGKLRLIRLLNRVTDIDEMKLGELKRYLNLLSQAKTEEEFNETLKSAKESK